MRRLPTSTTLVEKVDNALILFDDLAAVLTELSGAGVDVALQTDSEEFESLAELREHAGLRIKKLKLTEKGKSYGQNIELVFDEDSVKVIIPNFEQRGAVGFRLLCHARSWQRKRWWFYARTWGGVGMAFLIAALIIPSASPWSLTFLLSGALLFNIAVPLVTFGRGRWFGIHLRRRHEGGFWNRNGRDITLLVSGGIVGATLDKLFDWMLVVFKAP